MVQSANHITFYSSGASCLPSYLTVSLKPIVGILVCAICSSKMSGEEKHSSVCLVLLVGLSHWLRSDKCLSAFSFSPLVDTESLEVL